MIKVIYHDKGVCWLRAAEPRLYDRTPEGAENDQAVHAANPRAVEGRRGVFFLWRCVRPMRRLFFSPPIPRP